MSLPPEYATTHQFQFGDSPELADDLLARVLSGQKTATCGALRDIEAGEPMPQVGRRDVVLDGQGRPACAIETTDVTIRRFCDVDDAFAVAEGEGPYEAWRDGHIRFFERNGGFHPDMELVCERFRLVHIFERKL